MRFRVGRAIIIALLLCAGSMTAAAQRIQSERTLKVRDGVTYTVTRLLKPRRTVHTLVVDLAQDGLKLRLGKALDHISGLERVYGILHRFDSLNAGTVSIAGVNANFWQAGTNHPIGPTVIDGLVLNGEKHRNWSSIAITPTGQVSIDNYDIHAEVRTRFGSIPIQHFNGRSDSLSVVLYNRYFGSSVPFLDTARIFSASRDTITDESETDSVLTAALDSTMSVSRESGTLKLQFEYLSPPVANTIVPCRITAIDTSFMLIPRSGGVLSLGKGPFPLFFSLFVGDTFSLDTRLVPVFPGTVQFMASGTPRLVRDGAVSVEWQEEGLRKKRFVLNGYGRTALGITHDGRKAIFMTAEPPNRRERRKGVSLPELASMLVARGAWQAINFDGGSSATMVIDSVTVSPPSGTAHSRKISTALMIVSDGASGGTSPHATQ